MNRERDLSRETDRGNGFLRRMFPGLALCAVALAAGCATVPPPPPPPPPPEFVVTQLITSPLLVQFGS